MASVTYSLSNKTNNTTGKAEILLRYRNTRAVALRAKTHIFILPKFFSDGNITIKSRILTEEVRDAHFAKYALEKLSNEIITKGDKMRLEDFHSSWAQDIIDSFQAPKGKKQDESPTMSFMTAFAKFLELRDCAKVRKQNYDMLGRLLQRFELYRGKKLELDSFSPEDIKAFDNFLRIEHTLFKKVNKNGKIHITPKKAYATIYSSISECRYPAERGDNYVKKIIKMLRAFFHWCMRQQYITSDPFLNYMVGTETYGTPIYISIEERDQIYNTPLKPGSAIAKQRDIFVFQCCLGCRISDLYGLKKTNVMSDKNGTYIQYVPEKTRNVNPRTVKVYLTKMAIEIIDRYKDLDGDQLLPLIAKQHYNDYIKEIFKAADVTRMVTVINPTTGLDEQKSIADIASSHLARRTFVGNLYKKVKDPNLVGKLSGHKEGSKAFARYRDIDDDMIKDMTSLME